MKEKPVYAFSVRILQLSTFGRNKINFCEPDKIYSFSACISSYIYKDNCFRDDAIEGIVSVQGISFSENFMMKGAGGRILFH